MIYRPIWSRATCCWRSQVQANQLEHVKLTGEPFAICNTLRDLLELEQEISKKIGYCSGRPTGCYGFSTLR